MLSDNTLQHTSVQKLRFSTKEILLFCFFFLIDTFHHCPMQNTTANDLSKHKKFQFSPSTNAWNIFSNSIDFFIFFYFIAAIRMAVLYTTLETSYTAWMETEARISGRSQLSRWSSGVPYLAFQQSDCLIRSRTSINTARCDFST